VHGVVHDGIVLARECLVGDLGTACLGEVALPVGRKMLPVNRA
jgi:hypothetical protein